MNLMMKSKFIRKILGSFVYESRNFRYDRGRYEDSDA